MRVIWLLFLVALSNPAFAHDPVASDGQEQGAGMISALTLGVFWLIYLIGVKRRPPKLSLAFTFHAALALCMFAVFGPLDEWAETDEAAHMAQHMLFMVVIAPLWVLSRPLPQLMAAGGNATLRLWRPLLKLTRYPMVTAYIHGAIIWFWHMPYFYVLALENPWWHIAEHALFIVSAGLFWWAVLKSSRARAPWALLAVLLTLMHTGLLGALLTFAQEPLYGTGRNLADQQLAGLLMWVMGAVPYLIASAWIGNRWYRQLLKGGDHQFCRKFAGGGGAKRD